MFGFGWMEISLLLVVLILLFGVGPSGRLLGRLFGAYNKVNDAKQQLTGAFTPRGLINRLGAKATRAGDDEPAD